MSVLVELAVGEAPSQLSLAEADSIVACARDAGVTGVRLVDRTGGHPTLDPSIVAGYLAGRHRGLGWLIDAPTARNAPYNLARRLLSVDRATGGRAGLVLTAGAGDEVSDAAVPDRDAADPAERWSEYATILTRLWESFPSVALLGDQAGAVVADDALIRPIDFAGRYYRVAGPLDGPSSVQGRPVLVAADPATLGWSRVAQIADAVIIADGEIHTGDGELVAALRSTGRRRVEIALLARTSDTDAIESLRDQGADGIILALDGPAAAIRDALGRLIARSAPARRGTLRAELALPVPERAFA
ncbi:LLM class flavin-dependent oxidoreductase [Mycolicibacterium sp. P9-22]|uniref:LLM class flavin-dependent oxidoreductase n=1 Tax=Mycolicibacterium sp. P9-22 TaxID=2024613 RepID=UPI0011EC8C55|nr:LLM class flavin-dependent oxidoreductase [Mycolicibacterium sp. P9-22]KAA0109704.1 LLM class flavin-dependent oxidoreductase [Mycolicibacterium sp. P9-22]